MQMRDARLLCNAGVIQTATLRPAAGGWQAELPGPHGLDPVLALARGGPRVFKSLDAAVETLFALGLTACRVERPTP